MIPFGAIAEAIVDLIGLSKPTPERLRRRARKKRRKARDISRDLEGRPLTPRVRRRLERAQELEQQARELFRDAALLGRETK